VKAGLKSGVDRHGSQPDQGVGHAGAGGVVSVLVLNRRSRVVRCGHQGSSGQPSANPYLACHETPTAKDLVEQIFTREAPIDSGLTTLPSTAPTKVTVGIALFY